MNATDLNLQKGRESRLAILLFISGCDHSPSVREIGAAVGLRSSSTVQWHLDKLEQAGKLERVGPERRIKVAA